MGTGTGAPVAPPYAGGPGYGVGGGQSTGPPTGFEGVASPYHHHVSNAGGGQGKSRVLEVVLRAIAAVLALVCLAIAAASKQTQKYFDPDANSTFFIDFAILRLVNFKFLFATATIVLGYELVQIPLVFVAANALALYAGALATFALDQILAYLIFAAGASTATQMTILKTGDGSGVTETTFCSDYSVTSFCNKALAASVMGFVTFLSLAIIAFISSQKLASTTRS